MPLHNRIFLYLNLLYKVHSFRNNVLFNVNSGACTENIMRVHVGPISLKLNNNTIKKNHRYGRNLKSFMIM